MTESDNQNTNKKLVCILTIRGFGSEINNLLYSINYAKHKNIDLGIISTYWNFKFNKGLKDYFIIDEYKNLKILLLLFFYQPYINYLTLSFRKNRFSELTKQGIEVFRGENKNKNIFKENILSYSFTKMKKIFGIKSLLTFEVFHEIRRFNYNQRNINREEFIFQMNKILLNFWKFTPEISMAIEEKKREKNLINLKKYAVFHIRRGDKVAKATMEDRSYDVDEYILKLKILDSSISTIFLMTDDYQVFSEINEKFPNFIINTLTNPISTGHDQYTFNKRTPDEKRMDGINLLTELEIARKGEFFIGSRGSNLFRLIEYFKITGCHDLSDNSDEL